jgi:uncharacterized protein YfaP (DUF2135 family)
MFEMARAAAAVALLATAAPAIADAVVPTAAPVRVETSAKLRHADPYRAYKYRVRFGAQTVAAFDTMTLRDRRITLQRGLTVDPEFSAWASWSAPASGPNASVHGIAKPVRFDTAGANGRPIASFSGANCWVSHYSQIPNVAANANGIGIQTLILTCESLEPPRSM